MKKGIGNVSNIIKNTKKVQQWDLAQMLTFLVFMLKNCRIDLKISPEINRKELREFIKANENTNIELLEENEQIILIALCR